MCATVAELSFREKGNGKGSVDHPELILQIQDIELTSSDTWADHLIPGLIFL